MVVTGTEYMAGSKKWYPIWSPGKWRSRLKPAVPWWFNFEPYPYLENPEWRILAFCRNYIHFSRIHQKTQFVSKSALSPKSAFVSGKNASASLLHTSKKQSTGQLPPGKNMMTFPEKAVSHEKAEQIGLRKIQVCVLYVCFFPAPKNTTRSAFARCAETIEPLTQPSPPLTLTRRAKTEPRSENRRPGPCALAHMAVGKMV